jgi:hypothetical protein
MASFSNEVKGWLSKGFKPRGEENAKLVRKKWIFFHRPCQFV